MSGVGARRGWAEFADVLSNALRDLTIGELIRFEAWTTSEDGQPELLTHAYVIRHARHRARVAVAAGVGEPNGRGRRLSLRQDARLASAGWSRPNRWAGPDHYLDGDFAAVEMLADQLVAAFVDVWGLPDPAELTVLGRHADAFTAALAPSVRRLGA